MGLEYLVWFGLVQPTLNVLQHYSCTLIVQQSVLLSYLTLRYISALTYGGHTGLYMCCSCYKTKQTSMQLMNMEIHHYTMHAFGIMINLLRFASLRISCHHLGKHSQRKLMLIFVIEKSNASHYILCIADLLSSVARTKC